VKKLQEKQIARAKAVTILKKIPVFEGLLEEEYLKVLSMCSSTVVREGEVLFNQGDNGASMFVLLSGKIDVNVEGIGTVHTMNGGEIIGEIGLVADVDRTATAIIKNDSVLLHLQAKTLHEMVKKFPRLGYVIMHNVAKILADRLAAKNKAARQNKAKSKEKAEAKIREQAKQNDDQDDQTQKSA